jgi:hypothetical protein
MNLKSILSRRPFVLALATLLLLTAAPHHARAAFVLTLTQVGDDVVINGSGTINTTSN